MRYLVTVYFGSAKALGAIWEGHVDEGAVIYRAPSPWLWLARMSAKGYLGNTGRCGYVITDSTGIVDQIAPTFSA